MAYCFSFMFLMFQFDGQDVLVPYTHYQRNKGIGSKYYLRGTIYGVRSNELTKMQESSCPVFLRSFVQALYSQEPRFETEAGGNSEWKRGAGWWCVNSYSRTRARCRVRPAWLIKPQTLLTCFSQSNGGAWRDCTDKGLTWFYEVDSSLAFSWPLLGLEKYYSSQKLSTRIIRQHIEQDQEPMT